MDNTIVLKVKYTRLAVSGNFAIYLPEKVLKSLSTADSVRTADFSPQASLRVILFDRMP